MDSLGPGGGNKTICKVMGPEMKKKNIIGDAFFNSTTYLAFKVGLCVWTTFWPTFHQGISNLSTDLDSLGPGGGKKNYLQSDGTRNEKKILLETPFLILQPT